MIGSMWENMHTKRIAKVLSEPISGVFELMYEDRERQPGILSNHSSVGFA